MYCNTFMMAIKKKFKNEIFSITYTLLLPLQLLFRDLFLMVTPFLLIPVSILVCQSVSQATICHYIDLIFNVSKYILGFYFQLFYVRSGCATFETVSTWVFTKSHLWNSFKISCSGTCDQLSIIWDPYLNIYKRKKRNSELLFAHNH